MKKSFLAVVLLAGLSVTAAHADTALSLGAGTTGVSLHVTHALTEKLNLRGGINGFNYSDTVTTDDATYDARLKLQTLDALADYHAFSGGFRITGGLIYNNSEVNVNARPTGGNYTFQGTIYNADEAGTIHGNMDFKKVAPYLGIGFGNAAAKNKGWGFVADVGVMFQGSPDVTLTNNNCTADPTICSRLADDLAAENEELRKEAEDFRYYPVVRIGLSYKF